MTTRTQNLAAYGVVRPSHLVNMLSDMIALRRQRTSLSKLDDRTLRDIGVSREEADAEAARSVWDVPQQWHA